MPHGRRSERCGPECVYRGSPSAQTSTSCDTWGKRLNFRNDTFLGEVPLELAADAIEVSGASRELPIECEKIRERHLPECTAHTRAQHHKSEWALRAAAMIRAGVDPGLLGEVSWWRTDDLWFWALDALVVYLRVAAERTRQPIRIVCADVANRHGVALDELSSPQQSPGEAQR